MSTINYATAGDIDAILEKVIRPGVQDQLSRKATLYKLFDNGVETGKVTSFDMVNKTFNVPIRTGRNGGVMGYAAGSQLNHGKPALKQATVTAKLIAASMEMDRFVLAVKDAGIAAAGGVMAQYGQMLSFDLTKGMNRMLHGTSDGKIGTANATGTSTTTFVFAASTNGTIDYALRTPVGAYIKIGSNSAVQVTAYNSKNNITIASALSWSSGDAVKLCDANGNVSDELEGLQVLIGTGALGGVTDPTYVSQVDSSTTTLTEDALTSIFLQAKEFGDPNVLLANRYLYNKYGKLLTGIKRTANSTETLNGGWSGLEFMGGDAVVVLDYDAKDSCIFGIDTTSITRGVLQDVEWEDDGKGKMIRRPDYLERQAVLVTLQNVGALNRPANFVMNALTA